MYRCFYFVLLLVFLHSKDGNAQVGGLGMERMDSSTIEIGSGIPLNILNRSFKTDVLLRSEYSNEDFVNATINGTSQAFKLRYNNYLDDFEYEKVVNNIIYISKEQYKEVRFEDNRTYVLKEYPSKKETKEGYLLAVGNENSKIRIYTTQLMEYKASKMRSEERRVGKECKYRCERDC